MKNIIQIPFKLNMDFIEKIKIEKRRDKAIKEICGDLRDKGVFRGSL